ncbi:MAG TPA: glycosyltransferase [Bryobacteraceae bacterium]|jgi:putative flippase GtrA
MMQPGPQIVILIPAYQPGEALVDLVNALATLGLPIVVVDDGSAEECGPFFDRIATRVHLVRHAVNLGKGAALKTGFNYALVNFPGCAVVTADADGQHDPDDIRRIAEKLRSNPDALVMGVREMRAGVPLRSRIGNGATRVLMNLLVGQRLTDTQTGLRGIPNLLIPHLLRVPSTGYEFELDMLIACKHQSCPVVEEPIRTIYLEGNRSSHFHPVLDSMRIYLLLFRFSILSLLTAALDNAIFVLSYPVTGSIAQSQILGRFFAMIFNYLGARSAVFHSRQRHTVVLPKYVLLVTVNGFLSYALIEVLHSRAGMSAIAAKLTAEGLLFIANFAIQRDFVFTHRNGAKTKTDWDRYYTSVPATANLTRKYTTAVLVDSIRRFAGRGISIIEIGGANSCFLDRIVAALAPKSYDVVDTNSYGLSLLEARVGGSDTVSLHEQSVLSLALEKQADLVFSIGLVEHFDPKETREAILAHFDPLRPGGVAIISYPTPTLLYRTARKFLELTGLWKFPDERPLRRGEVAAAIAERGEVLFEKTLWPLILTQHFVVARKRA